MSTVERYPGDDLMHARNIIQTLERELETLRSRFGVKSMGLFGSIARGDASADSDVDILVEFDGPVTFDAYKEIVYELRTVAGKDRCKSKSNGGQAGCAWHPLDG